jgi:hypothetical protein
VQIKLSKSLKRNDIFKLITEKLEIAKLNNLRIFNKEGVELDDDDLKYI